MKKKLTGGHYTEKFYSRHIDGSVRSANIILDILFKLYKPSSVVEFGCGRGGWLAAAESLGSKVLKGFDGIWVKEEELESKTIDFSAVDFEKGIEVESGYDLAISLEVAEHLSESKAKKFVETICDSSDVVLFSAAIVHQGGKGHINEQWQSYWVNKFKNNGYMCIDMFRKEVWENDDVEWWYRQNIFLFVNKSSASKKPELDVFRKMESSANQILNMAHPLGYEGKINEIYNPNFNFCMRCFRRFVKAKFRKLVLN